MPIDKSALEIESGAELERFDLGTVLIGHTRYAVLTGYEGTGRCFWCGGELKGKLKRYCRGHMIEYYNHFNWQYASAEAMKRAGYKCENCGAVQSNLKLPAKWRKGTYYDTGRTNLEVHHIVPLKGESRFFSAYNLPWNLVVLCHTCHVEIHRIMNNKHGPKGVDSWEAAKRCSQSVMELVYEAER